MLQCINGKNEIQNKYQFRNTQLKKKQKNKQFSYKVFPKNVTMH